MSQPFNVPRPFQRLLIACATFGVLASAQAASPDEIKETSHIRIGYANETPFAFTETDGRVTGESPEIAKIIFEKMGIKQVDGVLTEWGSLIPGLRAGRFDVIAAGMYITPARCKQVIFTDPQYALPDTLLVAQGNPKNLHSYADIARNPDVKLAIMAGTVNLAYARDSGITDAQILQVPDTTAQLQAVRAGRADAAVGTQLTMKGLAKKGGDKVEAISDFTDDPAHTGYGALAFRPEDKALRDAVNAEMKKWLGSEEHLKTVAPFGFDRSNMTDKTAAELCAQQ
ncbi:ectoine/hydroxyectoine ABC transporter substrate-binding protein EhuB [Pseudomonas sp. B14(2017)]|uniref:ectoine/hydroxyectoine ABC transporter substrate-binding protein EhuB n=1 Tax=Pseudomonas sp. B14(2017) TaxID=1981745 RepID=UPI000A1E4F40|nr:ectoine/hydroxyectoine ABC transporter substrate-binding protein EhuB [Pseudomonas sp. B14(2017)]